MTQAILLEPMERAAEDAAAVFENLSDDEQFALHVRLLSIGAIRSGGPNEFLEAVFEATITAIKSFAAQHMERSDG
jgi:hypothetical protein